MPYYINDSKIRYQTIHMKNAYNAYNYLSPKGRWVYKREKDCLRYLLKNIPAATKALDIPCGIGRITELLLGRGMEVTAADFSEKKIKYAKTRITNSGSQVFFVKADIKNLHFQDNSFELVITTRLLHHMPPYLYPKVLSDLHRVTSRWLIITFSNRFSLQGVRRDLSTGLKKEPHYSISLRDFERITKAVGFRIIDHTFLCPIISESVFVLLEKTTKTINTKYPQIKAQKQAHYFGTKHKNG